MLAAAIAILGSADLQARMAPILPKPEEQIWLQIPWRMDLATARRDAHREGKPIFLWVMNGHPMGCT